MTKVSHPRRDGLNSWGEEGPGLFLVFRKRVDIGSGGVESRATWSML